MSASDRSEEHSTSCLDNNLGACHDGTSIDCPVDIVIVDDNAAILDNLRLLFAGHFTIATFVDVSAAIHYFKRFQAQLLITDLRMPKMNGFMFIREVQRLCPGIETVLMSAFIDSTSQADRAIFEPFTRHAVSKPYNINEMLSIVEKLLAS